MGRYHEVRVEREGSIYAGGRSGKDEGVPIPRNRIVEEGGAGGNGELEDNAGMTGACAYVR